MNFIQALRELQPEKWFARVFYLTTPPIDPSLFPNIGSPRTAADPASPFETHFYRIIKDPRFPYHSRGDMNAILKTIGNFDKIRIISNDHSGEWGK